MAHAGKPHLGVQGHWSRVPVNLPGVALLHVVLPLDSGSQALDPKPQTALGVGSQNPATCLGTWIQALGLCRAAGSQLFTTS